MFVLVTGPLSLVNIIGEKQSGLGSIFSITCSYCGHVSEVKSSGEHRARIRGSLVSDINTRAVLGSLHAGMENTHLNNLLSTMNKRTMNHCLFKRTEREVGKAVEILARESCEMKKFLRSYLVYQQMASLESLFLMIWDGRKGEGDTTLQLVMGLQWDLLLEKLLVTPPDARHVEYVAITK